MTVMGRNVKLFWNEGGDYNLTFETFRRNNNKIPLGNKPKRKFPYLLAVAMVAAAQDNKDETDTEEKEVVILSISPPFTQITAPKLVVEKSFFQRLWFRLRMIVRFIQATILLLPLVVTSPIAYYVPFYARIWWKILGYSLETLGASWIKLGQWASTRPDIFSQELIENIAPLCHVAPGHSFNHTKKEFKKTFGMDISQIFNEFSEEYIASGAIAQVHFARLHDGTPVAVKVLHPNISDTIEMDLKLMSMAVSIIELFPNTRWLSLRDGLHQFAHTMNLQADMRVEGRNLIQFNKNFANDPHVHFPKLIAATKSVLIETYEEGESITKYMGKVDEDSKLLARIGFNAYLQMMLLDNFIHADLHPGNILVRTKPSNTEGVKEFELVMLDVGLVTESSPLDWQHFKELFRAIVDGDGITGADLMIKYAKSHNIPEAKKQAFKEEMGALFVQVKQQKLSEISVGLFLSKVLSVVQKYQVQIEGNFATLCVGTIVLEGIGRQLDPDLNLLDASIPILVKSDVGDLLSTRVVTETAVYKLKKWWRTLWKIISPGGETTTSTLSNTSLRLFANSM